MFGVRPDRVDHEEQSIGAVDLARYTISHVGPDELGFGEVIEPVNALRVAILQQEHRARTVFRPREQEQMIGAEVEHGGRNRRAETSEDPRPIGSAVEGLRGGLLRRVIAQCGACSEPGETTLPARLEFLLALRRLSPPSRKISEFSTRRSAIAVAMVVLKRMLPQSENGVLVVMMVERFWLWRVEITW